MKEQHDLNRLPKWAKSEIERLRASVEYYKKREQEFGKNVETNIYIQEGIGRKIYLPTDSHLYFVLNGLPVSVMFRNDILELQGNITLQIHPRAANSFYVSQEREI